MSPLDRRIHVRERAAVGRQKVRASAAVEGIAYGTCRIDGPTVDNKAKMRFGGIWKTKDFTELRWIPMQDGELQLVSAHVV